VFKTLKLENKEGLKLPCSLEQSTAMEDAILTAKLFRFKIAHNVDHD